MNVNENQKYDKDDVVKAPGNAFYNSKDSDAYRPKEYYWCKLKGTEPDGDGDLSCVELNENGDEISNNYVHANSIVEVVRPNEYPWSDDSGVGESDETALDIVEAERQNLYEMQEVKRRTIAPDVLELKVDNVSISDNKKISIAVFHPVVGKLKFYEEKPLSGWDAEKYRIVDLLKSYNIYDGNPKKLEQREVMIELTGDDPENSSHWDLLMGDEAIEKYRGDSGSGKSRTFRQRLFGLPAE